MFKIKPKLNPTVINWCNLIITHFKLEFRDTGCVVIESNNLSGYRVIFIDQWSTNYKYFYTHPFFVDEITKLGLHADMFGCEIYSELNNE